MKNRYSWSRGWGGKEKKQGIIAIQNKSHMFDSSEREGDNMSHHMLIFLFSASIFCPCRKDTRKVDAHAL